MSGEGLRGLSPGGGVACRDRAIFCPVSLFDARSSPGDLIAEWSCVWDLCLGFVDGSIGVFVSYGGFYILGRSSCKCTAKAAQCGSANRCHWSVARFLSFHSGGGEDARGGHGGFFGWSTAIGCPGGQSRSETLRVS